MKNSKLAAAALAVGLAVSGAALSLPECMAAAPAAVTKEVRATSAAIEVPDVDETAGWYTSELGFRTLGQRTTVHGRRIVLERSGMLLEIAERDEPVPARPVGDVETTASLPSPRLSILVDDVDAETERLRARGVAVLYDPDDDLDGRFRASWIRDNGGRVVELREPLGARPGDRP